MYSETADIFSRIFRAFLRLACALLLLAFFLFIAINAWISLDSLNHSQNTKKEFAIVLGASVHGRELSGALKARMDTAINLYRKNLVGGILLSGDGTEANYSETIAMRNFALKQHVPQSNLITDEKGYSTYASLFRAREVFNIHSAYVISQKFHLSRAIWIARALGIDADGVSAGEIDENAYYLFRDSLAKIKDFFLVVFRVTPYDIKETR